MKRIRLYLLCIGAVVALGVATYLVAANNPKDPGGHHAHVAGPKVGSGPLSNATVSFGAWKTSPPLDRFPNISNTRDFNVHVVVPDIAKIKAGGTVNFIIAGFHQVIVYDDGVQPDDINQNIVVKPSQEPPTPPPDLIADPNRRIYRGLDPSLQPADRVEVVHFPNPGTYLVICGVKPHFQAGMFGYVQVLP